MCFPLCHTVKPGGVHSLWHVQALDAVAVDAVVERRMLQRSVRLQLLHDAARLLPSLSLAWDEIKI